MKSADLCAKHYHKLYLNSIRDSCLKIHFIFGAINFLSWNYLFFLGVSDFIVGHIKGLVLINIITSGSLDLLNWINILLLVGSNLYIKSEKKNKIFLITSNTLLYLSILPKIMPICVNNGDFIIKLLTSVIIYKLLRILIKWISGDYDRYSNISKMVFQCTLNIVVSLFW